MAHSFAKSPTLPLAVLSLVLLAGCHEKPRVERSPAASHKHPDSSAFVAAPGIVEPWNGETKLAALEAGVIAELAVLEGQRVK